MKKMPFEMSHLRQPNRREWSKSDGRMGLARKFGQILEGQRYCTEGNSAEFGDPKLRGAETTVFVGRLSERMDEGCLRNFFNNCGPIRSVRIVAKEPPQKAFAFVQFKFRESVPLALSKNETLDLVTGNYIRVLPYRDKDRGHGSATAASQPFSTPWQDPRVRAAIDSTESHFANGNRNARIQNRPSPSNDDCLFSNHFHQQRQHHELIGSRKHRSLIASLFELASQISQHEMSSSSSSSLHIPTPYLANTVPRRRSMPDPTPLCRFKQGFAKPRLSTEENTRKNNSKVDVMQKIDQTVPQRRPMAVPIYRYTKKLANSRDVSDQRTPRLTPLDKIGQVRDPRSNNAGDLLSRRVPSQFELPAFGNAFLKSGYSAKNGPNLFDGTTNRGPRRVRFTLPTPNSHGAGTSNNTSFDKRSPVIRSKDNIKLNQQQQEEKFATFLLSSDDDSSYLDEEYEQMEAKSSKFPRREVEGNELFLPKTGMNINNLPTLNMSYLSATEKDEESEDEDEPSPAAKLAKELAELNSMKRRMEKMLEMLERNEKKCKKE